MFAKLYLQVSWRVPSLGIALGIIRQRKPSADCSEVEYLTYQVSDIETQGPSSSRAEEKVDKLVEQVSGILTSLPSIMSDLIFASHPRSSSPHPSPYPAATAQTSPSQSHPWVILPHPSCSAVSEVEAVAANEVVAPHLPSSDSPSAGSP
ncbi:hypothetical protein Pcinc_008313 [Petrolisthes cinctipes]|uniref:Uncharacterized protein n=1 Tax=Petrolisthes cinctipes TaxID=88211 RepID=A0AAE1G6W4_PETCI|nr:hypothetical protein Pcinc_008313 [Petrolisthes cinctipes]